ncbi:multi-sensor signal transduction multi-kinase [Calothrix sp. NIES-4071]|nr:multi-sensor signal transduction multi-kinase [Calothrix sp. NIES-4071]BAZ56870.1 multi-sensor signal transduction multi-kinase [Calothrix sp. NIES-4105]
MDILGYECREIIYQSERSLVQAFRSLIQQLFTESQVKIDTWREKLLAAFGASGQVIIDVIPEVELIIGSQPAVPELPAAEAQNRFNLVFQNFIQVFTQAEHPLVLFLDDLQWSDGASFLRIKKPSGLKT